MSLISTIKHTVWRVITERMHLDFTLRSGIKVIVRNYADWCTYNDLFVNGEYREAMDDAIAEWKTNGGAERLCVLDLGANTGYFTLQMADMFLRKCPLGELTICPVEASPNVEAELRRRLVIPGNRVDAKVCAGLVGRREGSAQLNLGKEDTVNFVGDAGVDAQWDAKRGTQRVNYLDLDALTSTMPVVHLIKCDIEGSEFALLETYRELLDKTKRVVIEFHSPFGDIAQATQTLREMGFTKMVTLRESPLTPTIYFSRA